MPELIEIMKAVHASLDAAGIPHAFGGALALAFHIEEPRATRDIDVNVFVPPADVDRVFDALPEGVRRATRDRRAVERDGQVRLFWGDIPIDVFFSTDPFHDTAERRRRWVTLADTKVPILDATELTVFKAFFNRTKDWADIEAMASAGTIDVQRGVDVLTELLGPDDERTVRLLETLRSAPATGAAEPVFRRRSR